jgi:hypothetical protein
MIARLPWRRGPVPYTSGPVVISATRSIYKRRRDLLVVDLFALGMLRRWPRRAGSIGVIIGGDGWNRTAYTMSVWRSEADLRDFIRAADHVPLMRRFRPRQESISSTVWLAEHLDCAAAWREAVRRLERLEPGTRESPSSSSHTGRVTQSAEALTRR